MERISGTDKDRDARELRQETTLAKATRMTEHSLGYPLNQMCSLYYETTDEESSADMLPVPDPSSPQTI